MKSPETVETEQLPTAEVTPGGGQRIMRGGVTNHAYASTLGRWRTAATANSLFHYTRQRRRRRLSHISLNLLLQLFSVLPVIDMHSTLVVRQFDRTDSAAAAAVISTHIRPDSGFSA